MIFPVNKNTQYPFSVCSFRSSRLLRSEADWGVGDGRRFDSAWLGFGFGGCSLAQLSSDDSRPVASSRRAMGSSENGNVLQTKNDEKLKNKNPRCWYIFVVCYVYFLLPRRTGFFPPRCGWSLDFLRGRDAHRSRGGQNRQTSWVTGRWEGTLGTHVLERTGQLSGVDIFLYFSIKK